MTTLLADLVATSVAIAATSKRTEKTTALVMRLRLLDPDEIEPAIGFLIASPRQGRVGVGWRSIYGIEVSGAGEPSLTILDLDRLIDDVERSTGSGSAGRRRELLSDFLGRATPPEVDFVRRLFVGELRQGALAGVVTGAVAKAAGVRLASVQRAAMMSGDLGRAAHVAITAGTDGLDAIGLTLMVPVSPMLASSAPSIGAALAVTGTASVEWKFDGIRIQVHRDGDAVRVYTRNRNDITAETPAAVLAVRGMDCSAAVLDGEALWGQPETGQPVFFDILHLNGRDLFDEPLAERRNLLSALAGDLVTPGTVTDDPVEAQAVLDAALAAGDEGVVVKAIDSTYEAGRRGKRWVKVKVAATFDLVILGAEWGHGRRAGYLSNLHLGARLGAGFVMLGKTFKGLTDQMLAWQTAFLLEREIGREGIVVYVRPELVVEIALDGVFPSTRYEGGLGLRFARVKRYRLDKAAHQADTVDTVRAHATG